MLNICGPKHVFNMCEYFSCDDTTMLDLYLVLQWKPMSIQYCIVQSVHIVGKLML